MNSSSSELYQLDKFVTYITTELGLSTSTISAYLRDVEEFVLFLQNRQIDISLIEAFLSSLEDKILKPSTIKRKKASIMCLCHHLISLDLIDGNIVKLINPVSTETIDVKVLDDENFDTLIRSLEQRRRTDNILRDGTILLILYYSGLRVSELCGLNLCDINCSKREFFVRGKGCVDRIVPTTHRCVDSLKLYIESKGTNEENAIFTTCGNKRMSRRAVGDMLRSLSVVSGIKHTTPHTLRRSFATNLLKKGVELDIVKILLGHRDVSATQRYLAVDETSLKNTHKLYHPFGDRNE